MGKTTVYRHEVQWPQILTLLKTHGIHSVIPYIKRAKDSYERTSLFRFVFEVLVRDEWPGKNLENLRHLGEAAMEDSLATIAGADGREEMRWFRDQAIDHGYVLCFRLAPCWVDGFRRDSHHYRKGVELGERLVQMSMAGEVSGEAAAKAQFALGLHQLFLGLHAPGEASLKHALEYHVSPLLSGFHAVAMALNRQSEAMARLDDLVERARTEPALAAELEPLVIGARSLGVPFSVSSLR